MPAAHGQESNTPVTVFERPRPMYDAKGIKLGGFRLFPTATVSETYDDNIFAKEDDTKSDFITSAAAGLLARSQWSRHRLQVLGQVRHQKFLHNGSQDRTEWIVRPALRLDLAGRSTANLALEQSRRVIGRDDPEDTGKEEPTTYNRYFVRGAYTKRFNRLFAGANVQVDRSDYISGGDDDLDRTEYRFGLPLGYELSAMTNAKVEPFMRLRDYDQRDSSGANRDSRAAGATVGLDTEMTDLVHLNFDVGFVANDFADSRFKDSVDLIFGGEAVWYATPLTTVKARAERRDVATNQPGSSSKTQSGGTLEIQHELRRNILVDAQARYLNDDFREIDRVDNRAIFQLEAEYLLNRYVSLAADYRYEQRWSDASNEDFRRNLVTLGVKTHF